MDKKPDPMIDAFRATAARIWGEIQQVVQKTCSELSAQSKQGRNMNSQKGHKQRSIYRSAPKQSAASPLISRLLVKVKE